MNSSSFRRLTLALVALVSPLAAARASGASIATDIVGTVTDSASGQPLGSAQISVMQGPRIVLNTISDDFGRYRAHNLDAGTYTVSIHALGFRPTSRPVTLDGTAIPLLANINKLADTEAALLSGADGIGLYRTEFAFSIRPRFPTEEEQYEFLARAAERFHPREVVFRLLDLGGDKVLPYFPLPPSRNPSLAQRGVRLLLRHLDVLKPQLRAFLRVSAEHPVAILLPVVAGVEDVRQAREVVRQVQAELAAAGERFNPEVPVGAMIEVPSAALTARTLAKEVDFLSLGTNDLVQYVLAADREDDSFPSSYQPLHPGVLGLIHSVAEAARKADCELTMCGEMGGDPRHTALLLGLGLSKFSVAPGEMLEVKNAIRAIRLDDAQDLARQALELGSVAEIEALLDERRAPGP